MRLRWPRCGFRYYPGFWVPEWSRPQDWHVCMRPRWHRGKHDGPTAAPPRHWGQA